MKGRALENIHSDGISGVSYTIGLRYETDGSIIWNHCRGLGGDRGRYSVDRLADGSHRNMFEKDMEGVCCHRLEEAVQDGWEKVRAEHVKEHRAGMEQCSFTMPVPVRIFLRSRESGHLQKIKGETTV